MSDTLQEAEVCIAVEISQDNLQDIYLPSVLKKTLVLPKVCLCVGLHRGELPDSAGI